MPGRGEVSSRAMLATARPSCMLYCTFILPILITVNLNACLSWINTFIVLIQLLAAEVLNMD